MGLVVFFGLILLLVIVGILIRNNIVRYYNATRRAWSDVATFERQKTKAIAELMPLVEKYSSFEQGTLEKITELRQSILSLNANQTDTSQLQHIERLNQDLLQQIRVVVENYPDLKADEIYLRMMNEIDEQNDNVSAAITIFNRNVELFNNHIQVFPNNLINTLTLSKQTIRPFRDNSTTQGFDYRPNF